MMKNVHTVAVEIQMTTIAITAMMIFKLQVEFTFS